MKTILPAILIALIAFSCGGNNHPLPENKKRIPLAGTWQLISCTLIQQKDTVVTNYTQPISFIKIINNSHFAFLQHDIAKGKDSGAVFVAGGGKYTLKDSVYTEHLEYCSDRNWEGNDFTFIVTIHQDTLIQKGIEKVANTGVNRMNIEKYVRIQ
ncbi:lipocalin-like domain-containing protein [Hydrotalea sp.]|uniref:lipocalin-like domain-containing protein n=1 Tax=Hydrotalea sp. TaxID=2881279 RepID=UPI0026075BE3|nr:lipocalin-like domain-containing protein [Hydrotalea sp.]